MVQQLKIDKFSLLFLIMLSLNVYGQGEKKIEIIGDSIKGKDYFFVSEIHGFYELKGFEFELINFLHKNYDVSNIVLEGSKSSAFLLNRYLETGDTTIFRLYIRKNTAEAREFRIFWNKMKKLNETLPEGKKLKIYGIDFERMELVDAIKIILNKNDDCIESKLYHYLNGLPDTVYNLTYTYNKEKFKIFRKARNIFESEKKSLASLLQKDDYYTIKEILENPASEKKMGERDKTIFTNLSRLTFSNRGKFICILGGHHTDLNSQKSTLSRFLHSGNEAAETTVTTMVCKNCFVSDYFIPGGNIVPIIGPKSIIENNDVLSLAYDKYCKPDYYSLINQTEFQQFTHDDNHGISTYYVFFKDQSKQ